VAYLQRNKLLNNKAFILIVVFIFLFSISILISFLRLKSNSRLLLMKSIYNRSLIFNNLNQILFFVLNFLSENRDVLNRLNEEQDNISFFFKIDNISCHVEVESENGKINLLNGKLLSDKIEEVLYKFNFSDSVIKNFLFCLENIKSNEFEPLLECLYIFDIYSLYINPSLIQYFTFCDNCYRFILKIGYKNFDYEFLGIFLLSSDKPQLLYFRELPKFKILSQK